MDPVRANYSDGFQVADEITLMGCWTWIAIPSDIELGGRSMVLIVGATRRTQSWSMPAPPAENHSSQTHSIAFLHEEPFAGDDLGFFRH